LGASSLHTRRSTRITRLIPNRATRIVAAADTVMNRPSRELMAEVFPTVPYTPTAGDFDTFLSTQKARKLLGYEPQWSRRDHIASS
jgi:nucleoside-diphosphate-sugar epimerase